MKIMLNNNDLSKLKAATVDDIFSLFRASGKLAAESVGSDSGDYNPWLDPNFFWENAAELSLNQIQHYMETVSEAVKEGIKYIATNGPSVFGLELLENTSITTLQAFQGATTKRTRSVTKQDGATLLGWDNWNDEEKYPEGVGRYAVTEVTFHSLRRHFNI